MNLYLSFELVFLLPFDFPVGRLYRCNIFSFFSSCRLISLHLHYGGSLFTFFCFEKYEGEFAFIVILMIHISMYVLPALQSPKKSLLRKYLKKIYPSTPSLFHISPPPSPFPRERRHHLNPSHFKEKKESL
ncbi:hypothetical protein BDZ91DRAFT_731447 [Kalaharituber pfeilii]|nr:hypothetical protein BDZ91DRAFT_731447 [Kalaharituber pfeilii]